MHRRRKQSQAEVLAEANRLASAGMRQAALDLLNDYLDGDPMSVQVLGAVGRLYLLEKNYPKSIQYLQKVLQVGKVAKAQSATIDAYDEDYDKQDLDFVEAQNTKDDLFEEINLVPSTPDNLVTIARSEENLSDGGAISNSLPSITRSEETTLESIDLRDSINAAEQPINPIVTEETESRLDPEVEFILEEETEVCLAPIDEVIANEIVQIEQMSGTVNDFPDDDEFIEEEIYPEATADEVNAEAYELSWEEIDDLDAYNATVQEQADLVVSAGKLSREQRAKQVAIEVTSKFELDREFLPLLQTIFFENGWGASRVAIERELTRGTLQDELALAREVRHFWRQSDRYWITFRGLYSNSISLQTEATYKNMSWAEALRLVACFQGLPSPEEIEDLIEETFLLWYESKRLRRSFPVFFKFLKYRTASMPGTLSRWEPRYFDVYQEDGVEDFLFKADGREEEMRNQLWELGIDIYRVHVHEKQFRAYQEETDE